MAGSEINIFGGVMDSKQRLGCNGAPDQKRVVVRGTIGRNRDERSLWTRLGRLLV